MADPELLEMLRQGVEKWNKWREENRSISPDLREAYLRGTNLREANLREAILSRAILIGADLRGAFGEVILIGADLRGAVCEQADFSEAILAESCLIATNLNGATLTGACLWETQRARWSIKGVVCEEVYWDIARQEVTTFGPGEFERLWSNKTRVRIFYKDGINPLEFSTLPALVKHLEESHPGCSLRLESINDAPGGAIVTLVIDETGDSSPHNLKQLAMELETTAKQAVEYQRLALTEKETRLQLEGEVKQLSTVVDKLILKPSINFDNRGGNMGDTNIVSGQAGAVGSNAHAHDMTFNQIGSQIEKSMDLSQLADELAKLRQAMKSQATEAEHDIAVSNIAKAEQAAKAKDSSKVAESLKGAGKWALNVATSIGLPLAIEAIKLSLGMP